MWYSVIEAQILGQWCTFLYLEEIKFGLVVDAVLLLEPEKLSLLYNCFLNYTVLENFHKNSFFNTLILA